MDNNNASNGGNGGSMAVAFLIGAVAGGVTALLFAPKTGAQMRGQIKRGARSLQEHGEHFAHNMQDRAGHMKDAVSEARTSYRDEMDKQRTSPRSAVVAKSDQA
jgi:gas vesicle protein